MAAIRDYRKSQKVSSTTFDPDLPLLWEIGDVLLMSVMRAEVGKYWKIAESGETVPSITAGTAGIWAGTITSIKDGGVH